MSMIWVIITITLSGVELVFKSKRWKERRGQDNSHETNAAYRRFLHPTVVVEFDSGKVVIEEVSIHAEFHD